MATTSRAHRNPGSRLSAPAQRAGSIPNLPGLPLLGNLLDFRKDRLGMIDRVAKVGPVARFDMAHIPVYVVTDADLAHQILVEDAAKFKKSAGLQFLMPMLGDGLLTSEGETHKRHRKLLAPAFAPKRLAAYADIMVDETLAQLSHWRRGQTFDLAEELMEMTLAIAGRTLFGVDVRRDAATVAEGLELGMRAVVDGFSSFVQLGYDWPLPRHLKMRKAVRLLDDVVYRLIAEGRARGTDRGDVLSVLLMARDEDTSLSNQQVRDEVMTLLLAGHETTANTLSWTWYELGRNPHVLARVEEEVSKVLGGRRITAADLPAMPYSLAVIEEAMRLHPPAYNTGREALEDVTIGGHRLPVKSTALINIRGIHRRADYFPDPLAFQPERMFADAKKARPRHHYLPFGAGPRVCIGSHFALMEAQLALATMVQHASVKILASAIEPEPLVTLRPRGGLPARVERC